jgi:hypothetical protein
MAPVAAPAVAAPTMAHAADPARTVPSEGAGDTGGLQPAGSEAQVEPDLDDLARQVYQVLRRRLAAERRRSA